MPRCQYGFVAALFVGLAGCGSSNTAAPAGTPTATLRPEPTRSGQVVLRSTIPPIKGRKVLPPRGTAPLHGRLPTVGPAATFTPISLAAYTALIYGKVVDAKTGSPISGAEVTAGRFSGRTSAFGEYRFRFPAGVPAPVTVSATGYAGALAMGRLRPHQSTRVDFRLTRIVPGKPAVPPPPTTFGQP